MENNKPKDLIYSKMSAVMKDIGPVSKDQKNAAQGYKFRGVDQFVNALHPALVRHGVFMTPTVTDYEHELKEVERSSGKKGVDKHVHIKVLYTFYAEDGSSVSVGPIPAEGLDSGDKATNKALSAALKYALIQTFSIPTEDMAEADLDSPELKSATNSHLTGTINLPNMATTLQQKNQTQGGNTVMSPEALLVAAQAQNTTSEKAGSFRKANGNGKPKEESTGGWE